MVSTAPGPMDTETVRSLLNLVREYQLSRLRVKFGDTEICCEVPQANFDSPPQQPGTSAPAISDATQCVVCRAEPPNGLLSGHCRNCTRKVMSSA